MKNKNILLGLLYAMTIICFGIGFYVANETDDVSSYLSLAVFALGFILYFIVLYMIENTLFSQRKHIGTQHHDYLEYYMVGVLASALGASLVLVLAVAYALYYGATAPFLVWGTKIYELLVIVAAATHVAGSMAPRKNMTTTYS